MWNRDKGGSEGTVADMLARAGSLQLALFLFLALAAALIPYAFFREAALLRLAVAALLFLIAANLACCTVSRWRRLRWPTILCHLGFLLVLAGALWGMAGYVATVNVYENDEVAVLYRWDTEEDFLPGFSIRVGEARQTWYPARVRIGVLKDGVKAGLFEESVGGVFAIDGMRVAVLALLEGGERAELRIMAENGADLALAATGGGEFGHAGAAYAFRLVAVRPPAIKEVAAPVELIRDRQVVASALVSVNNPLDWQGHRLFLTSVEHDQNGVPYIGLQITKDPGVPLVYAGFAVLLMGVCWRLLRLAGWPRAIDGATAQDG